MAKKLYDEKINKHQDWGGDESTGGLPVAGNRVQEFIKEQLNSKAGVFHYDNTNNRYIVFADEESQDAYFDDPTRTDLIIGTFDAPFNYSAEITLSSPTYKAILAGTKNNYIDFTFDTKNKSGQSVGEDVTAVYTFIRGGIKKTVTERYRYGTSVHFNIDDYIDTGTNTITVGITGQNTLAATTVGITYQVVDLQLTSNYDVSNHYNLIDNPTVMAAIPYQISGYGTKIVEWYVDGVQLDYVKVEDEIVDVSTSRVKYVSVANLNQGKHSLQFRAYTLVNGERFYSNIVYHDLIIYTAANKEPIIAVSAIIPTGNDIITEGNLQLYGLQQYIPYELFFGVYNPTGAANTEIILSIDGKKESTVTSHNGEEISYSLRPLEYGVKTLTLRAGTVVYTIGLNISKSSTTLEPITNGLVLDLQALGKSNSDLNREEWLYGLYETKFTGFQWNNSSGWNNNRLLISNGAYIDVNIAPLSPDPTVLGRTLEFEFSTKNISNDNAVICDLRNEAGTGLLITASEVTLQSAGGSKVSTKFKSNENIRVVIVINPKSGTVNKGMAFIYTYGIDSGSDSYATTDNFTVTTTLRIGGTLEADVELKALRFYNTVLSSDQILNNYILYRDNTDELLSLYDRNNIYEEGTTDFSLDALAAQCPVLKITGDIPTLENSTDKNTTIYVDAEYVNLQDPTKSYTTKGMRMRPQGTSSMGYPKKNFRTYTGYGTMWDYLGNIIVNGLYSFKDGAQPVNVWCWKADYAESSGTHNTGIARLWNQVMYDAQINGQYLLRTGAQKAAIASNYPYDVRTCVDGFPCHIVYRLTEDSPWIYIGKYNYNNDKSTESVYGFRDIPGFDNKRMQCLEVLNNGNHHALFEDMDNFDEEWDQAYEFRYPEERTDISDIKDVSQWIVSTRHTEDTVYSGNITIAGEIKTDQNGSYEDNAINRQKKFSAEKWDYLDVYKVAAYYVYLMRFGAVDQVIKNAMFTTEGTQGLGTHCKWYFINYDNDTINGLRNDGLLVYNYDINRQTIDETFEALVYCYAGHESTLWNNLEEDADFMKVVSDVDNALYVAGLTYAKTIDMFDNKQAGKWCERVYNQDSQYKYVGPYTDLGTNNLFMLQGSRRSHRRWWLSKRFDLYDSKFVSGAYKAKSIEFKAANAPAGLQFSITAGSNLYYGYGLNNVPVDTGIYLTPGESTTFTTKQVINVGDPVRIYSAINIEEMDIHNFMPYLSTLNIAEVYGTEVGTKLKKLVMGVNPVVDDRRNSSLSVISGLSQATRLDYLDIGGYKGITNLDLSVHQYLTTLKAMGSGLTGLTLANGGLASLLELPDTMQAIVLNSLPNLTASGLTIANEWKSIYSITIKNCTKLQDYPLITSWYGKKTTADANCTLVLEGIEWQGVSVDKIIQLSGIKTAGGVFSIKGVIHLSSLLPEQMDELKAIFGENCFEEDNEIYFTAPDGVFVTGPSEVLEGNSAQYVANVFPSKDGTIRFTLTDGTTEKQNWNGVTINNEGLLTSTIGGNPTDFHFFVRAYYTPASGAASSYSDLAVVCKKRLYPTTGVLSGNDRISAGDNAYTLELSNPNGEITGEYNVAWELLGDAVTQGLVSLTAQGKSGCVVTLVGIPSDLSSFTVKATISGTYVTTFSLSKESSVFLEGVIMSKATNPEVMKICFAQNWCADENFMTEEEAAAVTTIGSNFVNTRIKHFDEFQYFTGLKTLPDSAFNYCTALTTITLPLTVTTLGSYCFQNCSALKNVGNHSQVTTLNDRCFYQNTSLTTEFNFTNVEKISNKVFYNCKKLRKVTFNGTATFVEASSLFSGCSNLEEVNFLGGITLFPSSIFANCTSLKKVTFPDGITYLESSSFINCSSLTEIDFSKTQIKALSQNVFSNCKNLTKILLPDSVSSIGAKCFSGCTALASFVIPPNCMTLDNMTFWKSSIETIDIPKTLNGLGESIDDGCAFTGSNIKTITVATDGNFAVENGVLYNKDMTALVWHPEVTNEESFTIPDSVTLIRVGAFMNTPLKKITFNASLKQISAAAFKQTINLQEIDLSNTEVTSLGFNLLYDSSVRRLLLPESFQPHFVSENTNVCMHAINLQYCKLPSTMEYLPTNFLKACGNSESPLVVEIPTGLLEVGIGCFSKSTIEELIFPDTLTTINYDAFYGCKQLKKVIANGVTTLVNGSDSTFYDCSLLETVSLGNVNQIGSRFFSVCPKLSSLTVNAPNAPTTGNDIFGTDPNTYTGYSNPVGTNILYVPSGATGYDTGIWVDPLQDETKCKFTISYTL